MILKVLLKEGKENESLVCVFWVCFRSGRGVVEPDLNLWSVIHAQSRQGSKRREKTESVWCVVYLRKEREGR